MRVHIAVLSLISLALAAQFPIYAAQNKQTNNVNAAQQQQEILFTQAELDQMLAPIALYPDTVLSHVLIAATYPLEVVKATRWLAGQPGMTSEQALRAAENQPWDPSVRALVAFSPLLTKMNNELEWTQKLGDAFLAQEADVMATVQQLRERAYKAGNLQNQQHIVVERKEKVIVIEPREREVVYVPVYDTRVVYGDWWWDRYPPIHWPYPSNHGTYVYWGAGARVSPGFYFSTFYWPQRQIVVIDNYRPTRYYRANDIYRHEERRHWSHNPSHRHGVVYPRTYQHVIETRGSDNHYNRRHENEQERRRWSAERRIANDVALPQDRDIIRTERDGRVDSEPNEQRRVNENLGRDRDLERIRQVADEQRNRDGVIGNLPSHTAPVETTPRNDLPIDRTLINSNDSEIDRHTGGRREISRPIDFNDDSKRIDGPKNRDPIFRPEDPVSTRPEPVSRGEEPEFSKPEPVLRREQPEFSRPEPVLRREEPEFSRPEPVLRREEPEFSRPEPVLRREEPEFSRPEPVLRREEPVFSRPEPMMQREEPVFSRPEPMMQREEPVFSRPEPVMQREEPVFSRPEPIQSQPVIESGHPIE